MQNQSKAYKYFTEGAVWSKSQKDTLAYLNCMLGITEIDKRNGKFTHAFDILWEILPVAEIVSDKQALINIHRKLGMLYGIYNKDSLSLLHLMKGLELSKRYLNKSQLVNTYLSIAVEYNDNSDYDNALKYLDSCYFVNTTNDRLIYIDAYYGHIYTKKGNLKEAKRYLNGLIPIFKEKKLAFLAMTYSFQGDLRLALNEIDQAIFNYKKSLFTIDSMKVHVEIKSDVLEKLAHLYVKKNDKENAYFYMSTAKAFSDSLFHVQSENNRELFEIKNKYQEALTKKEEQIIGQNKLLELKDKAGFRLKMLIGILIALAGIAIFTYRLRWQMKRMVFNKEKNEAILEIKNKELTVNALQIIEKEHAVNELLETVKETVPDKYNMLNNKYKQNNKKIWDDFHLSFTQTNNKFYENLLYKHPTLTSNDLKLCALIKLKFDSKEMSTILGISLHSVHMARSRIRKKLELTREDSLSNYLSMI